MQFCYKGELIWYCRLAIDTDKEVIESHKRHWWSGVNPIVNLDESQEKLICRSLYCTIKTAFFLVWQYTIM